MKLCAITNKKCHRWDGENTTLFCDTCPTAKAHDFYIRNYMENELDDLADNNMVTLFSVSLIRSFDIVP